MSENKLGSSHGQEFTLKQPEGQPSPEEIVAQSPELGLILGVMAALKEQVSPEAYQALIADMAQLLQDFEERQASSSPEHGVTTQRTLWQRIKSLFGGNMSQLNPVPQMLSTPPILVNNSDYDARGKRRRHGNSQHESHDEEHREARKMAGLSTNAGSL